MKLILIGLVAGVSSGLFGVGGGLVMVPLLVWLCGVDQHRAHATSLAAIVAIAGVAAIVFAQDGSVDLRAGAVLAAGALVGAPLGARLLARTEAGRVRIAFGVLQVIVGLVLVLQ